MLRTSKEWNNVPDGWNELPKPYRNIIKEEYKQNNRLKIGKTFTIGKILIGKIPELEAVNGVTYNWNTWKYVNKSWETKKD